MALDPDDVAAHVQHRLDMIQKRRHFKAELGALQVQGLPAEFREDFQRYDELVRLVRKFGLPVKVNTDFTGNPVEQVEAPRYVYFSRVRGTDEWKIGNSAKIAPRMKQLQTGNSRNFNPCFKVEGTKKHEALLHEYFGRYRIRREFFRGIPYKLIKEVVRTIRTQGYDPLEGKRA